MNWFEVDKEGLAKLLERRGKGWVLAELLQNAWDAPGTRHVDLVLEPIAGRPLCKLTVADDSPAGFKNLADAFTLFGESVKKTNPSLRGRFNLGEKLVLALCTEASISTTSGTVTFAADGTRRSTSRGAQAKGTFFSATVRMTRDEMNEALAAVRSYIPPAGIETTVNGQALAERKPLRRLEATLPTEMADEEGVLRRTRRRTVLSVHRPLEGMPGRIYEMGIPIVETGDTFDIDIGQKVPLSLERDSVTPAYLRDVRVAVLNAANDLIDAEAASQPWVNDALADEKADEGAVASIVRSRFGEKVVSYDPSDPEANSRAISQGYRVVPGGTFSRDQWDNIRRSGAVLPAGKVTPTPKPFSPDGDPAEVVDATPSMDAFAEFCKELARHLMGKEISVDYFKTFNGAAAYGGQRLSFNVSRLGKAWFEEIGAKQLDLVIHEFGHEYSHDHLSDSYYKALTRLGGQSTRLALDHPELFDLDRYAPEQSAGMRI